MGCPVCGYEEKAGTVCSQCHASLPVKIEKAASPPPSNPVVRKPVLPISPEPPPKEKFRRRPLMDLDLTIPELETEEEIQERLRESVKKGIKAQK